MTPIKRARDKALDAATEADRAGFDPLNSVAYLLRFVLIFAGIVSGIIVFATVLAAMSAIETKFGSGWVFIVYVIVCITIVSAVFARKRWHDEECGTVRETLHPGAQNEE